jgi:hypothetical protein
MRELCQKVNLFQKNHMTFGTFWLVLRCEVNYKHVRLIG